MGGKDCARHPAPRRIADEPEIRELVRMVQAGEIDGRRLEQHLERRQMPLFTTTGGGDDTDGNAG